MEHERHDKQDGLLERYVPQFCHFLCGRNHRHVPTEACSHARSQNLGDIGPTHSVILTHVVG